jgi:hypothetical protein
MNLFSSVKKLYETSEYNSIIHNISDVYYPLNHTWKKIGISCSGGADSTLLAYILAKHISDNDLKIDIHIISNIRMWKARPWQRHGTFVIYDYLVNAFKNINFTRHENFIPQEFEWGSVGPTMYDEYGNFKSGNQIELRAHAEYVVHTNNIDSWYCAVTKNPNDPTVNGGLIDREFKLSGDNKTDLSRFILLYQGHLSCHPFLHVEKDWIVGRYNELGILDLFEKTRSCEGDADGYPDVFNGLNFKNYIPGIEVPECGKCFWCQERAWGIKYAK